MKYFVVVFDTARGKIREFKIFDDPKRALDARFRYEKEHAAESDIEVALLRAASEKAIHETHPRYFAEKRGKTATAA